MPLRESVASAAAVREQMCYLCSSSVVAGLVFHIPSTSCQRSYLSLFHRTQEIAQWVKVHVTEAENLSVIPGSHTHRAGG